MARCGVVKLNNHSVKSGGNLCLDTPTLSGQDATLPGTQYVNLTKPERGISRI
jgi:hypothetical protein